MNEQQRPACSHQRARRETRFITQDNKATLGSSTTERPISFRVAQISLFFFYIRYFHFPIKNYLPFFFRSQRTCVFFVYVLFFLLMWLGMFSHLFFRGAILQYVYILRVLAQCLICVEHAGRFTLWFASYNGLGLPIATTEDVDHFGLPKSFCKSVSLV